MLFKDILSGQCFKTDWGMFVKKDLSKLGFNAYDLNSRQPCYFKEEIEIRPVNNQYLVDVEESLVERVKDKDGFLSCAYYHDNQRGRIARLSKKQIEEMEKANG